ERLVRPWIRLAMERRFPSRTACAAHWREGRLFRWFRNGDRSGENDFHRLPLYGSIFALPRPQVRSQTADARWRAIRRLRAESRSGRQSHARRAADDAGLAREAEARRGGGDPIAVFANALHGRGVRRDGAVSIFHLAFGF